MIVSEKTLEQRIVKYAESLGALTYKFVSPGHSGVPDRIFIFGGKTVFMELKTPGKKLAPLQAYQIRQIEKRGVEVHFVDSFQCAKKILDALCSTKTS